MSSKNYNDSLFKSLNWVLKKTNSQLEENDLPSIFIFNRWLSMANSELAKIVNVTFNRWLYKSFLNKESLLALKFYKTICPQHYKKIQYIKKPIKKEDSDNSLETSLLANQAEISQREILLYNQTLELLQNKLK